VKNDGNARFVPTQRNFRYRRSKRVPSIRGLNQAIGAWKDTDLDSRSGKKIGR
jgi:hypothetical protein